MVKNVISLSGYPIDVGNSTAKCNFGKRSLVFWDFFRRKLFRAPIIDFIVNTYKNPFYCIHSNFQIVLRNTYCFEMLQNNVRKTN